MAELGKAEIRGEGKGEMLLLNFASEVPRKVECSVLMSCQCFLFWYH